MKRSGKLKVILFLVLIMAMVVVFAGGWMYYCYYADIPDKTDKICFAMAAENCGESLLFNPILTIEEVTKDIPLSEITCYERFLFNAYCVAMVLIPIIDMLFVFTILDGILHFFAGISFRKNRVLVVGYNDRAKQLLDAGSKDSKIYLWTESSLTTEEERDLFLHRIVVEMNDFSLGDSPEDYDNQIKKFDRFLRSKRINSVVLVDEKDTKNIQYYLALSSCNTCKAKTIHFYVHCTDTECRNALQDIFDKKCEKANDLLMKAQKVECSKRTKKAKDTHLDLRIFNFSQIQAEMLFKGMPLYEKDEIVSNPELLDQDVHVLIVGGGRVGESIAVHALNQCVTTAENKITIDIIDNNTSDVELRMDKRFNKDYIKKSVSNCSTDCDLISDGSADNKDIITYSLCGSGADGELYINLITCDIHTHTFNEIITERNKSKYTYVVVALPDIDDNLHCALVLKSCLGDNFASMSMPIAFRIADVKPMREYFTEYFKVAEKNNEREKSTPTPRIFLMGGNEEYIGVDQIIDLEQEMKIREYNLYYEEIASQLFGWETSVKNLPEVMWNKLEYYKRQSNRALFWHDDIKKLMNLDSAEDEKFTKAINEFIAEKESVKASGEEVSDDEYAKGLSLVVIKDINGKDGKEPAYKTIVNLARTEHRRFNYFYASEGWGYNSDKKNADLRLHDCLCDWDTLCKARPDALIYDVISSPVYMK